MRIRNYITIGRLSVLLISLLVLPVALRVRAAAPGPVFVYPQQGQTLDYSGAYMFKVQPVSGAQGFLWGFFQRGVLIWENLRDEGRLAADAYTIGQDSIVHERFVPGDVQVWVRAMVNNQWTDATVITIHLRPIRVAVLQLDYYPPDPTDSTYLDPVETGWRERFTIAQMRQATQAMVGAALPVIGDATRYRGYRDSSAPRFLDYFVLERKEFLIPMPRGHALGNGAYRPNYGQITRDLNICDYVDRRGVKEVWIYGYHGPVIVSDESKMSSKYGDISNANPHDEAIDPAYRLPICTNSYVLYNFTYQPGGATAFGNTVHNRMHQIENVIFFAENRGYPPNDTRVVGSVFWDDFAVYGSRASLSGYRPSCGNTHAPPNVFPPQEYIYDSRTSVLSNCATWHPDDSKTTYTNTNYTAWGCTDVGFYKWFMQNMPGLDNAIVYNGKQMRNWWEAMYDFNRFITRGRTLYRDYVPVPVTPTPRPTATPTAIPTPTAQPPANSKVCYRYHTGGQPGSWSSWACDGAIAGGSGLQLMDSIQLRSMTATEICFRVHQQNLNWVPAQSPFKVCTRNGSIAQAGDPTTNWRIEAIQAGATANVAEICYRAYYLGAWQPQGCQGATVGTSGQNQPLQAIAIKYGRFN